MVAAIEARGLVKVYGETRALDGLDLDRSAHIDGWPMQHPIEATIAWSVLLIAVFAPIAVRLYQQKTAV